MSVLAAGVSSLLAVLIPPATPYDAVSDGKQTAQQRADLYSPRAEKLLDQFFNALEEGKAFDLETIFTSDARYVRSDGSSGVIATDVDDSGFPDIPQWSLVGSGVLAFDGSRAAIVEKRLDPVGSMEAVLKVYFGRNTSGALRIARVEEVGL